MIKAVCNHLFKTFFYKKTYSIAVVILTIVEAVLKVAIAILLIPIIQQGITSGLLTAFRPVIIYITLFAIMLAIRFIKRKLIYISNNHKESETVERFAKTLFNMKVDELEASNDGDVVSIVNNDWKQVKGFLDTGIERLLIYPFIFIFRVIVMGTQNLAMTVIIVCCVLVTSFFTLKTSDKIEERIKDVIDDRGKLLDYEKNCIESLAFIKAYGLEDNIDEEHKHLSKKTTASERLFYRQNAISYLPSLVNEYLPLIVFTIVALFFVNNNSMQFGEFAALLQLTSYISLPMSQFLHTSVEFSATRVIVAKMQEFFSCNKKSDYIDVCDSFMAGGIVIKNGKFKYSKIASNNEIALDDDNFTLRDINLRVNPGEKIAIVGKSGSGKSTLVNLIAGFYSFSDGNYTMGDREVTCNNREQLFPLISYVNDKLYLLQDDVIFNICLSHETKDRQKLHKLADMLSIEDLIDCEKSAAQFGVNFSGGQQLKISLSRALYKDAPILILDEPTAHLDIQSKEMFFEFLKKVDKTVVIISHDKECVSLVDRIYVISQHGEILEVGKYSELDTVGTHFHRLFHTYREISEVANETT